jgi:hypothetical protein
MESTKGFILDRETRLCLISCGMICSFLDVKNSFTSQKNYRYWMMMMMMMIDFDSCVYQHPMWPSYEESIDHTSHPWRNEPNDRNYATPWFCHGIRYYSLWKYEHVKRKRERERAKRDKAFNQRSLQDSWYMWPTFPDGSSLFQLTSKRFQVI